MSDDLEKRVSADLEKRVSALEMVTGDLSTMLKMSQHKLGINEGHLLSLTQKVETTSDTILAHLNVLQNSQNVHMARSDEKFANVTVSMERVINKLDSTADRLSANESLSNQLRVQNAGQFEQLGEVEAEVATIKATMKTQSKPNHQQGGFIDSPNMRWIMAPVIIILLGLFGLAGYNMSGDAKTLLGTPGAHDGH